LATRAAQISLGYHGPGQSNFQDVSDAAHGNLVPGESAAQIVLPSGGVQDAAGDPAVADAAMLSATALARTAGGNQVTVTTALGPDREPFRVLGVPLQGQSGSPVLVVATSLEEVNASVHRLLLIILAGIPVALAAAGLVGWLLARKALGPVARMTGAAERIGGSRLDDRIVVPSTADELARLARTLNAMLDRLQEGVDGQRRFVADASHDLRTPLTVMRSEIEVALEGGDLGADTARSVLVSNREEVGRMMHMVENLLTLASIQDGCLELLVTGVDLHELVSSAVEELRPLGASRGIDIAVEGDRPTATGDRERLKQVATNVVENAVKYSDPGSSVHVRVWERADEAGFTVTDAGPGIPEQALTRVFERFVRLDGTRSSARDGSGLGLAICRDIVEAHGGRIWAESSAGAGSSFWVALPGS
ncbi:MAG: ATP-binding protein, partial [Actinomycetota bacterium]|nr:ATP-binding protein [Actinomycetota bacterium]